jgi:hypothetical protein
VRGHVERRAVAARAALARQASIDPRAREDGTAACMHDWAVGRPGGSRRHDLWTTTPRSFVRRRLREPIDGWIDRWIARACARAVYVRSDRTFVVRTALNHHPT